MDTSAIPATEIPPPPKRVVCGAQLRGKPGQFCQRMPLSGRTRCALHGGKTPQGEASPHYRHGLISKALPKHLRDRYKALLNDPDILDSRPELALLQTRLVELVSRVETGESVIAWQALATTFAQLKQANKDGDGDAMARALNRMQLIIDGKLYQDQAWGDLTTAAERITTIANREAKRQSDQNLTATYEQVRLIVMSIVSAVNTYVHDPQARQAIAAHVARLRILDATDQETDQEPESDPAVIDGHAGPVQPVDNATPISNRPDDAKGEVESVGVLAAKLVDNPPG